MRIKLVSLATAIIFVCETAVWSAPPLPAAPEIPIPSVDQIKCSDEAGIIEESYSAGSGSPLVVYIQDAHCLYEAQSNIRRLIDELQKKYGAGLVALEGGEGKIQPVLFRAFPAQAVKEQVLDAYLKRGELSGAEFAAVANQKEAAFWGIENMKLYRRNKQAFLEASAEKENIIKQLDEVERGLEEKRQKVYSLELNQLYEKGHDYQHQSPDLLEYVRYLTEKNPAKAKELSAIQLLVESIRREEKMDSTRANEEAEKLMRRLARGLKKDKAARGVFREKISDFKLGKIKKEIFYPELVKKARAAGLDSRQIQSAYPAFMTYIRHLRHMRSLRGEKLFREITELERQVKSQLFQNEEQKQLDTQFRELQLLRGLANLELTREEYERYRLIFCHSERSEESISPIVKNVFAPQNVHDGAMQILRHAQDDKLLTLFAPHQRFYELALERDRALHANLLEVMKKEDKKFAVLVTGGFHTAGITERLKRDGISYLTLVPQITNFEEASPYWNVMRGKVSYAKFLKHQTVAPELFLLEYAEAAEQALSQDFARAIQKDLPAILQGWKQDLRKRLAKADPARLKKYTRLIDKLFKKFAAKTKGRSAPETTQLVKELAEIFRSYFEGRRRDILTKIEAFSKKLDQLEDVGQLDSASTEALLSTAASLGSGDVGIGLPIPDRTLDVLAKKLNISKAQLLENPLFTRKNVPKGFVPILHFTKPQKLEGIGKEGLKYIPDDQELFIRNQIMDFFGAKTFRRSGSVYAYVEQRDSSEMGKGNIGIIVYVDPEKVFVVDAEGVAEFGIAFERKLKGLNLSAEEFWEKLQLEEISKEDVDEEELFVDIAEHYYKNNLTLAEYLKRRKEEQEFYFVIPEVLIPYEVPPEFLEIESAKTIFGMGILAQALEGVGSKPAMKYKAALEMPEGFLPITNKKDAETAIRILVAVPRDLREVLLKEFEVKLGTRKSILQFFRPPVAVRFGNVEKNWISVNPDDLAPGDEFKLEGNNILGLSADRSGVLIKIGDSYFVFRKSSLPEIISFQGASLGAKNPIGLCVTGDTLLPVIQHTPSLRATPLARGDFYSPLERGGAAGDGVCDIQLIPIRNVRAGDEVLSLNEATQEVEPHRINALLDMGVKPVYRLRTASGRSIKTTANHPYLVHRSKSNVWVKVSGLRVGEQIAVPKEMPRLLPRPGPCAIPFNQVQFSFDYFFRGMFEKICGFFNNFFSGHSIHVDQNHSIRFRNVKAGGISEIFVIAQNDPMMALRVLIKEFVRSFGQPFVNSMNNFNTQGINNVDQITVNTQVGQNFHDKRLGIAGDLRRFFAERSGKVDGVQHILFRNAGILFGDFIGSVTR
ncbi:MAG: hypothetical protein HY586_02985, partial [Candidatus Omnitrophica bacterium]|nr:hypothetical protein [Candidatus Omnitrophota bacterium]